MDTGLPLYSIPKNGRQKPDREYSTGCTASAPVYCGKKFYFFYQTVVITRLVYATSVNEFGGQLFTDNVTLPSVKAVSVTDVR